MFGHRIVLKSENPLDADHAASFLGPAVAMDDRGTLRLTLDVTKAGTTLDVTIQTSEDGASWRTLDTFTQATGVGRERKCFAGCDRYVRASCAVVGDFRFTIAGDAV